MLKRIRIIFTKSQLSLLLAIAMILGLLSPLMSQPAQAEIVRSAQIEKVIGVVHIQKAGGVKQIRAYEGMVLYRGDHIQTEANSSMVFQVPGRGGTITVEENSRLYISDLRNDSGKVKTSFFIWNGSIWVQASTLTNSEDEFKIETPDAFMNVRGTTLLVGVDPTTGESKFFIASGIGVVNKKGEGQPDNSVTLYPNEQINLDKDTHSDDYEDYKNIADLNDLIANTSTAIIEAIIASKAAMDQENEQYIENLREQQGGTGGTNQEVIDRINQNLDNLVGNIINNAIKQNKVDEAAIKAFIEQINEQLDKKLDLDNIKAPELSAQEKAKQAQINLLNEQRKQKQEVEKLKQEAHKKQNEELQKKLKEQLEKQKEAKEKAAEAAKQRAAEEFAKKLANDAARLAFQAKQEALAAEKAKQEAAAKGAVDAPAPVSQPSNDTGSDPVEENPGEEDSGEENPTLPLLTIVSPTAAIFSNSTSQDIVVQTKAGTTLQLYNGDTLVAVEAEISEGDMTTIFTFTVSELEEGIYNFTVKAIDEADNEVVQIVPSIHIDTTAPIIENVWGDNESPFPRLAQIHVTAERGHLLKYSMITSSLHRERVMGIIRLLSPCPS